MALRFTALILLAFGLGGCGGEGALPAAAGGAEDPPLPRVAGLVTVPECYSTTRDEADNVDSPAVWHGPQGQHWLIATAKHTDRLLVHEAATGALIRKFGEPGVGPGQFERPNGIFVIDDTLWIVERDNRRVQVLSLPGFETLVMFGDRGEPPLRKPYGLWVQRLADGDYRAYVTDNYETADEQVPPLAELDQRVQRFRVRGGAAGWEARQERPFGDTGELGALRIVESVWGDAEHDILIVADEEEYQQRNLKVYDLEGRFGGRRMGAGVFHFQPEGIALYACADGSGWWFTTDQGKGENFFHVFERRSLAYRRSFTGRQTLNTDGIWMSQQPLPGFAHGAFFAVHDDGNVAAFDLGEVLDALGLARCTAAPRAPHSEQVDGVHVERPAHTTRRG